MGYSLNKQRGEGVEKFIIHDKCPCSGAVSQDILNFLLLLNLSLFKRLNIKQM